MLALAHDHPALRGDIPGHRPQSRPQTLRSEVLSARLPAVPLCGLAAGPQNASGQAPKRGRKAPTRVRLGRNRGRPSSTRGGRLSALWQASRRSSCPGPFPALNAVSPVIVRLAGTGVRDRHTLGRCLLRGPPVSRRDAFGRFPLVFQKHKNRHGMPRRAALAVFIGEVGKRSKG